MSLVFADRVGALLIENSYLSAMQWLDMAAHAKNYIVKSREDRRGYINYLQASLHDAENQVESGKIKMKLYNQNLKQDNEAALSLMVVKMADQVRRMEGALKEAVYKANDNGHHRYQLEQTVITLVSTIESMQLEIQLYMDLLSKKLPEVPLSKKREVLSKDQAYWHKMNELFKTNGITLEI